MTEYDSTVELSDQIPMQCWRCWYHEGRRCYAPALKPEFDRDSKPGWQFGPKIEPDVFYRCRAGQWFASKRAVLERTFAGCDVQIVIASERRTL